MTRRATGAAYQAAADGLVNPHTADVPGQKFREESKATGERMAAERKPTERRLTTNLGNAAEVAGQQLLNNPRLAQLADQKRCMGAQH